MQNIIKTLVVATAMILLGSTVVAATSTTTSAETIFSISTGHGSSSSCEDLRRACENKNENGEQGQGNCRRYHEECGHQQDRCERLRSQCMNKEQNGNEGMGLCHQYHEECDRR